MGPWELFTPSHTHVGFSFQSFANVWEKVMSSQERLVGGTIGYLFSGPVPAIFPKGRHRNRWPIDFSSITREQTNGPPESFAQRWVPRDNFTHRWAHFLPLTLCPLLTTLSYLSFLWVLLREDVLEKRRKWGKSSGPRLKILVDVIKGCQGPNGEWDQISLTSLHVPQDAWGG